MINPSFMGLLRRLLHAEQMASLEDTQGIQELGRRKTKELRDGGGNGLKLDGCLFPLRKHSQRSWWKTSPMPGP